MKKINFTLAMFRIYRILVQCLKSNSNKKMFQCAPKRLEIINDIMAIIENKVIEPYMKWFIEKNPYYNSNEIRYIEEYYKKGRQDNNMSGEFPKKNDVPNTKKFVERSMEKYDKEILSKKDQI